VIGTQGLSLPILDKKGGYKLLVPRFGDHLLLETGLFVDFHLIGHPLLNVLVSNLSGKFRYDHPVIGIPLADNGSLIDLFPVLDEQLGTVGNVVGAQSDPGLGIDDLDLGGPGYYNIGLSTAIVHSCHGTKILDLHYPTKLGYELAV